ncbi:hypothetical protein MAQ58_25125, partial [Enterobacter sp. DRP3]|nr:hypothetical protein [Enterobacter sp. DRP3]
SEPSSSTGGVYGDGGYTAGYAKTTGVVVETNEAAEYERYKKEEKQHKKKEHLGEMGALAAGAFALVLLISSQILSCSAIDPTVLLLLRPISCA